MRVQDQKKIYIDVCTNLAKRRLKPAFDLVGKLIEENSLGEYVDEHRNLEETYHYMLKYTVEGISDPERQKVYRKLIVSVFELADKVNEALLSRFSTSLEYEKKRAYKDETIVNFSRYIGLLEDHYLHEEKVSPGHDVTSADTAEEHLQRIRRLFYHVWFRDKLTHEEAEGLRSFLMGPVLPMPYKSFIVTAVTLSLYRYFDPVKFNVLFDTCDTHETEVNQRALVGLLINVDKYDTRMPFYPDIVERMNILNENPQFRQNLERIIIQFIRSKETEKLQQRIRDEILPEMIKISPNLKDKINLGSLMEEGLSEDKNPDWEEIFKDSPGLLNKMEEFSELQMEGADVFMGSFSMLKSFPFYNEVSNWFMPYFIENPELTKVLDVNDAMNRNLMEAIGKAPILCNSDKYSFCFSLQSIPKDNREFLIQGINAEMDQFKEIENDESLLDPAREAEFISNQYIQDLYRFFKLFPRRNDFEDIFSRPLDFHRKFALHGIINDDSKLLRNIAEYYFARNHFQEAADIFSRLIATEKSGELYQKLGYCYQKRGDFSKALEGYLKADLYAINRQWNLKKIALCYRMLKQPEKALEYYKEAEKIEPDNLNNQLNIGHCLLELNEFEEALKVYFKVEYLAPGNKKVWRPIAWCSYLTGKKQQAEKYLSKLILESPNKHDYMNMGHVQWSLGNRKEALAFYQQSISEEGFTVNEFLQVFDEDLPHLIEHGVDADDVPIMLDQLRYSVEK